MNGEAIVLDIGGTYVRAALVNEREDLRDLVRIEAPNFLRRARFDGDDLQEELVDLVERCVARAEDSSENGSPKPVGVAFPGPVDRDGTVLSAPTLWGSDAEPFPLGRRLRERLGTPHVAVTNDMTAATWYLARHTPARRFCVVTVSSGIGNKVFDRDHPHGVLLLRDGGGGEIGHVTVDGSEDAPRCDCGGRGHLGGIASGRGVERLARRRAVTDRSAYPTSPVLAAHALGETITNERHLVPAIRSGDEFALSVLREATHPLVRCLATLDLAIGVEQFVFIGGFALAIGRPYLEIVRALWDAQASYHMGRGRPDGLFVLGHRGEVAALLGAGLLAQRTCAVPAR